MLNLDSYNNYWKELKGSAGPQGGLLQPSAETATIHMQLCRPLSAAVIKYPEKNSLGEKGVILLTAPAWMQSLIAVGAFQLAVSRETAGRAKLHTPKAHPRDALPPASSAS